MCIRDSFVPLHSDARQRNRCCRQHQKNRTSQDPVSYTHLDVYKRQPLARVTVKRHKEDALRYDLRQMRDAIDRYKDAADKGQIQVQAGTEGYPPDLQTLVHGVALTGVTGKNVRFLRRIPIDPMTGNQDWGMRSVQDDTDTTSWGGTDVFDVFTKSSGTALNGTRYSDW